jgi:hypothetical protein
MKAYLQYKENGKIWQAGHTIYGLCAAWNNATNPSVAMTDEDHTKSRRYARAIINRMNRLGFAYGVDYLELSNGSLFPKRK